MPADDIKMRRVRRLRRKRQFRKAAITQRERVFEHPSPGRWVFLGFLLAEAGRWDQATDAYKQGQYLHRKSGSVAKAAAVNRLLNVTKAA